MLDEGRADDFVDGRVVRDSLGAYHLWVENTDAPGSYAVRWRGDDVEHVANETTFDVDESVFETP